MSSQVSRRSLRVLSAVLAACGLLASSARAGDPVHVLNFEEEDGSYTDTDLVIDGDGVVFSFTP